MSFPLFVSLASDAIYKQYAPANKPAIVGTLGVDQFGSWYRMCKAGAAIAQSTEYPVASANVAADGVTGDMATVDLYSDTAAVGDIVIRIDDTSSSTRVVNFYEGGVAHFYGGATTERQTRRILSSTVGDGTSIYLTLDAALDTAITDGAIDALTSPYSNCVMPAGEASSYETFVAWKPIHTITSGYYFWGKTRGPTVGHYSATWPGSGATDKDVYFQAAGTITSTETVTGTFGTVSPQRAGFGVMCNTSNYGSVYFMLQLE